MLEIGRGFCCNTALFRLFFRRTFLYLKRCLVLLLQRPCSTFHPFD